MFVQPLTQNLVPAVARFLTEQRQQEARLDTRLWLADGFEEKLTQRLTHCLDDPEEQIWLALDRPASGPVVLGTIGARAKGLSQDDSRRSYLPPRYGLIQLATLGVQPGLWTEVLPGLWTAAQDWFVERQVLQPQVWITSVNTEGRSAFLDLGFEWLMDSALRFLSPVDYYPHDPPSDLRIRPATMRDVKRILPLFIEELDFHARLPGSYWLPTTPDTPRLARREIEIFLTAGPAYTYMLAERISSGDLLGYMSASTMPPNPDTMNSLLHPYDRSTLQVAIVTEAARRQRVGQILLEHTLAWFCRRGMRSVMLSYDRRNPLSGPFWRGHRFQPYRHALAITLPG